VTYSRFCPWGQTDPVSHYYYGQLKNRYFVARFLTSRRICPRAADQVKD
jgi:hypothetical protein